MSTLIYNSSISSSSRSSSYGFVSMLDNSVGETTGLDVLAVEHCSSDTVSYCLVAAVYGIPADILEDSENYRYVVFILLDSHSNSYY